jgi:hypothetical protein
MRMLCLPVRRPLKLPLGAPAPGRLPPLGMAGLPFFRPLGCTGTHGRLIVTIVAGLQVRRSGTLQPLDCNGSFDSCR